MNTTRKQRAVFAVASVFVTAAWLLVSVIGPAYLDPSATQVATAMNTTVGVTSDSGRQSAGNPMRRRMGARRGSVRKPWNAG